MRRKAMKPNEHYKKLVEKESELWGSVKPEERICWFDSPTICRYINQSISGKPDVGWLDYCKQKYGTPRAALGLNVGCGHGELERAIIGCDLVEHMVGVDISVGAVEIAREKSMANQLDDRITYRVADANYLEEAGIDDTFDVVFVSMALHHFAHLEKCLDSLNACLKPNGLLIVNEFIGPNRFQWTDAQIDITNRLLGLYPNELKKSLRDPEGNEVIQRVYRPSVDYMKENFAFEAICSERIVPAVNERFHILEQKNYGGTILHLLFEAIMGNFKEESNREHAILVQMACTVERMMLNYGMIQHDHALIIAHKK
jgi:ubiquinone/menaquinone biosynthesis C-methylase UbiE